MPVRHNFKAGAQKRRLEAVIAQGLLAVTTQTVTVMQEMVSRRGRGKVYAVTEQGVATADRMIGEGVGMSKANQARAAVARRLHTAFGGTGEFDPTSVLTAKQAQNRATTRRIIATRVGFNLPKEGIRYLQGSHRTLRDAGFHQASAPGDPPAPNTGHLRRNIQMLRPKRTKTATAMGWRMSIAVEYAFYLEFGTLRMLARPYVRPSLRKMSKIAPKMLRNYLRLSGFSFMGLR